MLRKSMRHAIDGIKHTFRYETNFKLHLIIFLVVVTLGNIYRITPTEWIAIILVSSLVISAELFNTAIENTLDWLEPNHHASVKIVKDICAGAVLVTTIGAVIVGLIIFGPHLLLQIGR